MVSNLYCEDVIPPPDDDDNPNSGSLSGIEGAVDSVPNPGGNDYTDGGGYSFSAASSGTYISVNDLAGGLSNIITDNTWLGGSDVYAGGGQGWSLSDVNTGTSGGVFGKIRDAVILDTASSTSGITALITSTNSIDSKVSTAALQNTINNNIIELQDIMASGVSATVGDVTIVGNTTDFATQTTLASILLDTADIETAVENIDGKVSTAALQTTINSTLTSGISELSKELYALDVSSTSGYDATVAQILSNSTEGLPGIVTSVERLLSNGSTTSGLDGIYTKAASIDSKVATAANQGTIHSKLVDIFSGTADLAAIRTNTALTQAGLSAVNIRASDGTTISETSNALDVFIKGSAGGGNSMNVSVESVFGSESAMGVSSAGSLPISLETNNAGNLNVNVAAVGVPQGVFSNAIAGVQVRNGVGAGSILSVSAYGAATSILIDEDVNGDNPQSNTTLIVAPGATNKLVIDGYNISMIGDGATSFGRIFITEGNAATRATGTAGFIMAGRCQGTTAVVYNYSSNVPIGLAANTALKFSTEEGNGNIYIYGSLQYRIVAL